MLKNCAIALLTTLMATGCALETEEVGSDNLESHSWGGYHWARTASNFALPVVNSVTSDWAPYVSGAVADWSSSQELDMVLEAGDTSSKTRRRCSAPEGKVRICNLAYGNNGWLGIAGISLDSNGHISSGYTKLNDSYFSMAYYNDSTWKQSVTCQELGHDVGLDHQDEDFNNTSLKTCMDYQDPPWPSPNSHDYAELGDIYAHLDSYNSYAETSGGGGGGGGGSGCNAPPGKGCNKSSTSGVPDWGASLGRHGNVETFVQERGDGTVHITKVTWAD